MSLYQDDQAVTKSAKYPEFYAMRYTAEQGDQKARMAKSGIYRCKGCGDEIAHMQGNRFPLSIDHRMQDHAISWQLRVIARHSAEDGSGQAIG